jgi:Stress responsive A/B Barrel Domain
MKLQHVVLFGFAESADARAISEVARHFALLQTLVPDIDAFVLTFGSTEARDAYLIHPDHIAFADWVKPFVASVTVFDYWAMAAAPAGSIQV